MTILEYIQFVEDMKNGEADFSRINTDTLHAVIGMVEEAGEMLGHLKKVAVYNKDFDKEHLREEAGDVFYHLMLLCNSQDWTLMEIMEANVQKLKRRYPTGKFNYLDAAERKDKTDGA